LDHCIALTASTADINSGGVKPLVGQIQVDTWEAKNAFILDLALPTSVLRFMTSLIGGRNSAVILTALDFLLERRTLSKARDSQFTLPLRAFLSFRSE